ncbi:MAG: 3-oxoadipate enol-lactonase, partial [Crocinitomix sp.]
KQLVSEMNPQSNIQAKTVAAATYNFHYYVSGKANAPLLVFVHPAFADHRVFNSQVDFFSKKYRVITVDLIGHGLSQPKRSNDKIDQSAYYIDSMLKNEGYDSAHFIGISLGSLVIQQYQDLYPEKVKSLTIVGGYDIHEFNDTIGQKQNKTKFAVLIRAIFSMKAFRRHAASLATHSPEGETQFYCSASRYTRLSFPVMSGLSVIHQSQQKQANNAPLLLMVGQHDLNIAKTLAKEWHNNVLKSEFVAVNEAGHCINLDQPEQFNNILLNFLTNIEKDKLK